MSSTYPFMHTQTVNIGPKFVNKPYLSSQHFNLRKVDILYFINQWCECHVSIAPKFLSKPYLSSQHFNNDVNTTFFFIFLIYLQKMLHIIFCLMDTYYCLMEILILFSSSPWWLNTF
jgi:hypothetical protein